MVTDATPWAPYISEIVIRDLGPNLRVTPYGYQAYVTVHGRPIFKRFKTTATLTEMRAWVAITRGEQLTSTSPFAPKPKGRRGHFDADARRYLAAVTAMPTFKRRKAHIEEWIAVFSSTRRDRITAADIQAQLHTLKVTGLSASSVNHRRTALMHLYTKLDGKSAPNPVRDVEKFREPTPQPLGVAYPILEKILAKMPASKQKARALVIAYVGIPHALLKQITEDMVDWTARTVWVPERRKGKGMPARLVPLTPKGLAAFTAMRRYDAWGSFNNSRLREAWNAARIAAGITEHIWPYRLRHSFGTYAYARTGDLHAVKELLGQSDIKLTARYAAAAVPARLQAAVALMGGGTGSTAGNLRPGLSGKSRISGDGPNRRKTAK